MFYNKQSECVRGYLGISTRFAKLVLWAQYCGYSELICITTQMPNSFGCDQKLFEIELIKISAKGTRFGPFLGTGFGEWLCSFQKSMFWFDHIEMELEAHIWCVSSTHQYCSHIKYELLTPSASGRTRTRISEKYKVIFQNLYQKMSRILSPNAKISVADFSKSFDRNNFWSKIP